MVLLKTPRMQQNPENGGYRIPELLVDRSCINDGAGNLLSPNPKDKICLSKNIPLTMLSTRCILYRIVMYRTRLEISLS